MLLGPGISNTSGLIVLTLIFPLHNGTVNWIGIGQRWTEIYLLKICCLITYLVMLLVGTHL